MYTATDFARMTRNNVFDASMLASFHAMLVGYDALTHRGRLQGMLEGDNAAFDRVPERVCISPVPGNGTGAETTQRGKIAADGRPLGAPLRRIIA